MKTYALALIGSLLLSTAAIAQKEKPASPPMSAEKQLDDLTIKIDYSSPFVKEREIFGGLEPWNEVWRAGANAATTIEFNKKVMIEGEELKAGKYAFFVIPKEDDNWTLIFNTEAKQWGAYKYDESKDALRIEVEPEEIDHMESLTYTIDDSGIVHLKWANTAVGFQVE